MNILAAYACYCVGANNITASQRRPWHGQPRDVRRSEYWRYVDSVIRVQLAICINPGHFINYSSQEMGRQLPGNTRGTSPSMTIHEVS